MINKNTTIIKKDEMSIRIIKDNGTVYFAARDILQCCGKKWVDKYLTRTYQEKIFDFKKLEYKNPNSFEKYRMFFGNKETVIEMLNYIKGYEDVKKWIVEDVLNFEFEASDDNIHFELEANESTHNSEIDTSKIVKRIEEMILELEEMKSQLMK